MARETKVYKFKCPDCDHEIEFKIEIKTSSEGKTTKEVVVYCPFCDKKYVAEIPAKPASNATVLRSYENGDKDEMGQDTSDFRI